MTSSKSIALRVTVSLLVTIALSTASGAEEDPDKAYDPPDSYPEAVDQIERPTDFFAAVIAAYQADREWFKRKNGVELTPSEFARRHDRVLVSRLSNGKFEVQMGPERVEKGSPSTVRVINFGRTYIVDAKSFEIVESDFDR